MLRSMAAGAALMLTPLACLAQESARLNATEMFDAAHSARVQGDVAAAETLYRALTQDPDVEVRSEARFRLGMMLSELGRHRDAAVQFRALLDEKPDAQRVRIELARVLALIGDEPAARRELRQVQSGPLPPGVSQAVDQFANALRSRKPLGASVEFALVPDSNINRATDSQTLDTIIAPLELSGDARNQSGIGARVAGQVFLRRGIAPDLAIVPRVSGQAEFYKQDQFNDLSASGLIGLEWSPGRERFQLSAGSTARWYGQSLLATTATVTFDWQHPLGKRTQITAGASVARSDYRLNDLQDGWLFNGEVGVERAFSTRAGGGLTGRVTRQTAADPAYASISAGGTALGWREFGRTSAFAVASVRRLEADARMFLYPRRRRDLLLGLTAGATLRALRVRGFAPVVRLSYERNFSTIEIYDYRRVATTLGVSRAF
ncbi:surface lipoprotein assembly modifier [Sphingomonas sp. R647]|uniref:surface lipoprotein assembly modifier n=1 Tax=Sphingomonas sp. R647 TaxID=2875233 RepID=UPI001CD4D5E3|nr:surface lipoprotein assembly modifier [Sphingomonas sp. R647]MCA1197062.1 surface lipoprotein assembly modifier [Sphingomonas sp. R647]